MSVFRPPRRFEEIRGFGIDPADASRELLGHCSVAATPMTGWGAGIAARFIRFVYSAEPVKALETLAERLQDSRLLSAAGA